MAASKSDIRTWLHRAKAMKATHMIVVCDCFDYEDYPVFVMTGEDARARAASFKEENMQRVMEVYDISMDLEAQLNEHRAFHY